MDYGAIALACMTWIMAIWMLLHGIRGAQKGVMVEGGKGSTVKDYYYRGDMAFTLMSFFTSLVALLWWVSQPGF